MPRLVLEAEVFRRMRTMLSTSLADGVDIRALAAYLGHQDPAFTLRIYTHLVPDAAERMRKVVDKAARAEANGPGTARQVQK